VLTIRKGGEGEGKKGIWAFPGILGEGWKNKRRGDSFRQEGGKGGETCKIARHRCCLLEER